MTTQGPYTTEELMETFKQISSKMKADIRIEFDAGRITGTQYAEVYLGMLTTAIQSASQFYLSKDSAWAQRELHEAEIKRIEAQTLLSGEELLQAKVTTSIATETKGEQVLLVENQLKQGIKQLDVITSQLASSEEQLKQQVIQTRIATATEDEQVRLTEQQLLQATEQVKGLQEQILQSKVQTEISTATKADQIAIVSNQLEQGIKQLGMMDSQMKTAAEQLLQAKIQTEVATSTKDEQIKMAEVSLKQQEDALAVSQERHGMNFKPAFTQG